MIDLCPHIDAIARRLLGVPNAKLSTSAQLRFGTNGSIAVESRGPKSGSWFDHETGESGGPIQLIETKGNVVNGQVVDWLRSELGIEAEPAGRGAGRGKFVATYDYRDEQGDLLFQVVRFDPKDFRQRRPDGRGGWNWSTTGVRKVPYRLPELNGTPLDMYVFVCEGEKDVDRLIGLGLKATCNPGGAARRGTDGKPAKSKWPPDFGAQFFRDRRVVILPDNDDAGRDHAQAIVKNLAPVSHKIKFIELPGLPPKGDVSDWLNAGGTREELEDLVLAAPDITVEEPDAVQAEAISIVDGAPEFSDEHLALEFARRHEGGLRYTAIWGRWYLWSGVYWRADQTLAAFDLARVLCRDASSRITDPRGIKLARMIASSRTVASITTLARSDRVIATEHVAWDYDEWTLNSS